MAQTVTRRLATIWRRLFNERGQALPLIGLAFIGLMAFVALAIDGSNLYAQRRIAQNAADGGAIAGAYRLRVLNNQILGGASSTAQTALLTDVNEAVEAHGIPDTDGTPGNSVNSNVEVYYTNTFGERVQDSFGNDCQVGSCTYISTQDPWGVDVVVINPFDTYVANVIGWGDARVQADAIGVVHAGAVGDGNKMWAIFGTDDLACGGDAANISGSSTDIIGNAHSNADFKMTGARAVTDGQVTYLTNCQHCRSNPSPAQVARINLVFPNFEAYKQLAMNNATGAQRIIGDKTLGNGATLGSVANPITYIDGDLTISGNLVTLTGLIFVTGDVRFSGRNTTGLVTIVTEGAIDVVGSAKNMTLAPYEDATNTYPILKAGVNVALFYTNASGSNACSTPIISFSGSSNVAIGSIMAPNGRIDFSGSSNYVTGSLVANRVSVSGSNNRIEYNGSYFPPQPDQIELLE